MSGSYTRNAAKRRSLPTGFLSKEAASELVDIGFCAVVILAILLNIFLGPLTPALVSAAIPAFGVMRWEKLPEVFRASWTLLLLPLLAIFSVTWSVRPGETVYYGTLFLITVVAAVIMGSGMKREAMLKGAFVGLFIFSVLSLLFGRWVGWGGAGMGGVAFAGLLGSKNSSGEIAGMALLASLTISFWAVSRRAYGWLICGLICLPVALITLVFSKATGALIAGAVATFCLLLWNLSRRLPLQARVSVFVLALIILAVLILFQDYWLPALFDAVLESSGKDADLTGRSDLWRKADSLIAERPWLGMGYSAFWVHNNLDAEYLWRLMDIGNRSGFNFHNTAREILVSLGYVGFAFYVAIAAWAAVKLLLRTMLEAKVELIFACSLLIYFILKLHFESFGFGGMHVATVLGYAILAMGLAKEGNAAEQGRPRS